MASNSVDYTTTGLLNGLKRRALIPSTGFLYTDADLLAVITDEMNSRLVPEIKSAREEFFVSVSDVPFVSGQQSYDIPSRALGAQLRDVALVDSGGNEFILPRLDPSFMRDAGSVNIPSALIGYYWQGNKIMINSAPAGANYSLRLRYERKPNDLTPTASAARISAINTGTKTVTCDSGVPNTLWATTDTLDFISARPPFNPLQDDAAISSLTSTTAVFSAALPTDLQVGDWISTARTTPVPQIPYEAFPVLEQLAAARISESIDDASPNSAAMARSQAESMMEGFLKLISPRTAGTPQKIVDRTGLFGTFQNRWR